MLVQPTDIWLHAYVYHYSLQNVWYAIRELFFFLKAEMMSWCSVRLCLRDMSETADEKEKEATCDRDLVLKVDGIEFANNPNNDSLSVLSDSSYQRYILFLNAQWVTWLVVNSNLQYDHLICIAFFVQLYSKTKLSVQLM